ncbi:helix-turn-helix transcriptional regulator [Candidatus Bathyarchaeota archaeon]|jgi:putative transcriptional regulator|nr:helix-turn-helix transcriptional regulator [Candidatus Bathyarchaeota archaeon]MBT4320331.1 helix-turn-helix transcriptional regulator [Candidatus Bathyarchaeota archaeon]MBT4424430.1 helix-turn-helix transcriptional regulator [Candidatus Bathyarchaeota archaeon]MBT5642909.1 helix-turn-helix transcriptional regulator [Candidatus Bathyarchaeota archaeon]MBT6604814.1 helix-turn-helix transcriptional regulator [Candidatus Bathyarchaeota archaeon]
MRTIIKMLRARDGLTQADLAKKAGVRRETISFVENGEYNPSLLLAVRIARTFGEPVEEIFLYEDEELAL